MPTLGLSACWTGMQDFLHKIHMCVSWFECRRRITWGNFLAQGLPAVRSGLITRVQMGLAAMLRTSISPAPCGAADPSKILPPRNQIGHQRRRSLRFLANFLPTQQLIKKHIFSKPLKT